MNTNDVKNEAKYEYDALQEQDLVQENYFAMPLDLLLSETYPHMLGKSNFIKEAVTYALIRRNYHLSALNAVKYTDESGRLFCYFTINELCRLTGFSKNTATTVLENLVKVHLIERESQGPNLPWKIYVYDYKKEDLMVNDSFTKIKNIIFPVPHFLLEDAQFEDLSLDAKLLYAYMLNFTKASFKYREKYCDKKGAYIMVTQEALCDIFRIKKDKLRKCMNELSAADGIGLIDVECQHCPGKNLPNKYYIKAFQRRILKENLESQKTDNRTPKKPTIGVPKNRQSVSQKTDNRTPEKPTIGVPKNRQSVSQKTDTNRDIYNNYDLIDNNLIEIEDREENDRNSQMQEKEKDFSVSSDPLSEKTKSMMNDEQDSEYIFVGPGPRKNLCLTQDQVEYIKASCDELVYEHIIRQASMKKRSEERKGKVFNPEDDFDIVLLKLNDYEEPLLNRRKLLRELSGPPKETQKEIQAEKIFYERFKREPNPLEKEHLEKSVSRYGAAFIKEKLQDFDSIITLRLWLDSRP